MDEFIPALDIKQGNDKTILLLSLTAGDLKEISYFNTRDVDRVEGLQRQFDNRRSRAIAEFVSNDSALLSNNIILNLELAKNGLELKDVYDGKSFNIGLLKDRVRNRKTVSEHEKIAFVVDGQHRLRAFEHIDKDDFNIPVSALVDLSLAEVAELFVQINYNQKPVNKSHVFDLLGISENIFPKYYLSHKAVVMLQDDSSSPLYNKIKMLGVGKGFISQAALITAIEKYKVQETIESSGTKCDAKLMYNVLWHFFTAVANSFPEYWGEKKLLSKTVGIKTLINLMNDFLNIAIRESVEFSHSFVESEFSKISDDFFGKDIFNHLVGEKGVTTLYKELKRELGLDAN
ncbi:DGQHR domain-containing protein [Desulfogranum marinum]|uniref:DGQHR domain-containing protein n=1 Tax=Desulfogranum marinum TaxID=453220 RepID=UPI001962DC91|nr:DGQHR domain-containing protein [Desulfogranum marinum]MBM9514781.1 DGQHR domain-containing protein [Desulfogranum marinum]